MYTRPLDILKEPHGSCNNREGGIIPFPVVVKLENLFKPQNNLTKLKSQNNFTTYCTSSARSI